MFKNFLEFLFENSPKSLGLGEPKALTNRIAYDGNVKWEERELELTEREIFESIANNLSLVEGEMFFDKEEFIVSGVTEIGNVIYIEQHGEFNMYGGLHTPKMGNATATINGKNVLPVIIEEFQKYGDDSKNPDMSRTDIYGYIMNKDRSFFLGKKYGI